MSTEIIDPPIEGIGFPVMPEPDGGDLVSVEIQVSDDAERSSALEFFVSVGCTSVQDLDGVVAGYARRGELKGLLDRGLSADIIRLPPMEGDSIDEGALEGGEALTGPTATDASRRALYGFAQRSRAVDWKDGKGGFEALEGPRAVPDPTLDGFDIEGLDVARQDLPEPEALLSEDVYRMLLTAPMDAAMRAALDALGVDLDRFEPPNAYDVFLTPKQVTTLRGLPFVAHLRRYGLRDTVSPNLSDLLTEQASDTGAPESMAKLRFAIGLHRAGDLARFEAYLRATEGIDVLDADGDLILIEALADSPILSAIAHQPMVRCLEHYQPPRLLCDEVRAQLLEATHDLPPVLERWTGEGETVAVFDSGVDASHEDLAGRLKIVTHVDGGSSSDDHGHGTHVVGILAGTGVLSDGRVRGVAPGAQVVSVGIVGSAGELLLPINLGSLLEEALPHGAKIINLSWGQGFKGEYQVGAASIDAFVERHPDILVVVAAGNAGTALGGEHDFRSIYMPASAKNVITVGASSSKRRTFPDTWGSLLQSRFPEPPVSDLHVAGDPDYPAANSSRGPTDFRTVKPDLLAPGTFILATKAKGAPMTFEKADASDPLQQHYGYMTGTSMAAPVVAGAAALLRERLRVERGVAAPSAALLKALLIAAARPGCTTRDEERVKAIGFPDFDQGFGILELRPLLGDDGAAGGWRASFVDIANGAPEALEARRAYGDVRKSQRIYRFRVKDAPAGPLRVVLAWTDPPGRGIQNVLGLQLRSAGGTHLVGNERHKAFREPWQLEGLHGTDRQNNVQEITLPKPSDGNYRVTVTAADTAKPPQGYALVLLGRGITDLEPLT
jgi:hypothetical protein